MADNPEIIQQSDLSSTSIPLFLIHDGGGTIFQYYALGDLGRTVYGICNPGPRVKTSWKDGMASMAQEYCSIIKDMQLEGPIILGGWSLGGVISLEMAQILSEDDELDVVGVVLIDSLYPPMVLEENAKVARHEHSDSYIDVRDISYNNNMTKEVQAKILTSLNLAVGASLRYELPSELNVPPAVLIRASLPIPSREGEVVPHALGWDRDEREIVKLVYQVPGHHFSMFEEKNALPLTSSLSEACTMLENRIWA